MGVAISTTLMTISSSIVRIFGCHDKDIERSSSGSFNYYSIPYVQNPSVNNVDQI